MPTPIITVAQLDFYIKGIFDAEELLHGIRVEGEVSGCSVKSGNAYFTLKDDAAQIACCCFGVQRTICPQNGDNIIVTGRPDFYIKSGKLSFIAEKIEQKGYGQLYLDFLALKQKLSLEGLFLEENKIPLPSLVKNLCVITSHQGAVVQDILSTIAKKTERMNITVVDCKVQGVGAVESICNALFGADRGGFDAVLLARGGGSFEDLMPFNTEQVARAVAGMATPIISAIGHETDFSLSDFAADCRALTPTAGAELVAEGYFRLAQQFLMLKHRLYQKVHAIFENTAQTLKAQKHLLSVYMEQRLTEKENALGMLLVKLEGLNPNKMLKSGYIVAEKNGKRISSIQQIEVLDQLQLIFPDGKAGVAVAKKELL